MDCDNLALRPNCLLTKHPVIFVTGARSLFYTRPLASRQLLTYIKAHGYRTYCPPMAFRNKKKRWELLKSWLQNQSIKKCHIILSTATYTELKVFLPEFEILSYTILASEPLLQQHAITKTTFIYKIHALFLKILSSNACSYSEILPQYPSDSFYNAFLDHFINLAENEPL